MELEALEGKRDEQKVREEEGEGEGCLVRLGLGFREVEERNWRDDISLLRCLHAQLALTRKRKISGGSTQNYGVNILTD